ncbi:MAG: AAA family ATPase [Chloroflexota bacterium]
MMSYLDPGHSRNTLPRLVLVSGSPAAGKTTLARHLAKALHLPLVSRDILTGALADSLRDHAPDDAARLAEAKVLAKASFAIMHALIVDLLANGQGVIAETNYLRGISEHDLLPPLQISDARLVHCEITRDLSLRRFTDRFDRGGRHWAMNDGDRVARIRSGRHHSDDAWDRAVPLDLEIPLLRVNTTNGYDPGIEVIIAFAKSGSDAPPNGLTAAQL